MPALAIRGERGVVLGEETSGTSPRSETWPSLRSGTIQFGHSIDQSIASGGRACKSARFVRCSRKMGKLRWCVRSRQPRVSFFAGRLYLQLGEHVPSPRILQHALPAHHPNPQRRPPLSSSFARGFDYCSEDRWEIARCPGSQGCDSGCVDYCFTFVVDYGVFDGVGVGGVALDYVYLLVYGSGKEELEFGRGADVGDHAVGVGEEGWD